MGRLTCQEYLTEEAITAVSDVDIFPMVANPQLRRGTQGKVIRLVPAELYSPYTEHRELPFRPRCVSSPSGLKFGAGAELCFITDCTFQASI